MPFRSGFTARLGIVAKALTVLGVVIVFSAAPSQPPPPTAVASPAARIPQFEGDDSSTEDTVTPPQANPTVAVGRPESRPIPPLFFGMQMHSLLSDPKRHTRSAESAAALGARFVRDELFWHEVEKNKGVYAIPEVPIQNLKTNKSLGLETLIILDYTNDHYDEGRAPVTPEAVEAFGRYCFHMAEDLKDLCRYFEIWNEPNTDGFWRPKKDPKAYARLMETAIREIRRGNPDAVIFAGALSGIDVEFMNAVRPEADCTQMDIFSIHPYCTPKSPGQAGIFDLMEAARQSVFPEPQTRRPIWVTEIGYPTNLQGGVSEWRQAEVLAQTFLLGTARPELQGVVWYWMGPDGPDAYWAEDRFGVIRPDFKGRKPAAWPYDVLAHTLRGLTVSTVVQEIPNIPGSRVIRFQGEGVKPLTAIYVEEGDYCVDILDQESVTAIPLTAATPEALTASPAGPIQISISPMPILLRADEPLKLRKSKRARFLYTRSENVPRGGSATVMAASRVSVKNADMKTVSLWPGRLEPESIPADLPWKAQAFKEGEAAELSLDVPADAAPQEAPLAAYWYPPKSDRPAARLVRSLQVADPVTLDIHGLIGAQGVPLVGIAVSNTTDHAVDVDLRVTLEGRDEKSLPVKALQADTDRVVTLPVKSMPTLDAVIEVVATATLPGGVEVKAKNFLSFMYTPKLEIPPTLDGDLSDWTVKFPPIDLNRRNQIIAERDTWGGADDASARVWTGWDDDWFYIAAQLYDDLLVEEATGFTVYNNDGLELYFDSDRENGRKATTYGEKQFQYGLFPSQGDDVVYDFHHAKAPSAGGRIKITRSPQPAQLRPGESPKPMPSMIIEAAIPMKELRFEPLPGAEIGFSIALNDDDSPGFVHPFSQDLQMQWSRQRNAWQRPAAFASLWLVIPAADGAAATAAPPAAAP